MTVRTRPPTPQGISRLLSRAGYQRSELPHNEGFRVTKLTAETVAVEYQGTADRQEAQLKVLRWSDAIFQAGYQSRVDKSCLRVTVTLYRRPA